MSAVGGEELSERRDEDMRSGRKDVLNISQRILRSWDSEAVVEYVRGTVNMWLFGCKTLWDVDEGVWRIYYGIPGVWDIESCSYICKGGGLRVLLHKLNAMSKTPDAH